MDEPRINADQPWKKPQPAKDPEQQAFDRQNQLDPAKCANCGATPEPGYRVPLCKACRDKLSRHPVPIFIIIGLIAVLGLTAMAFTKFPQALKAGVAFSRGEKLEKAGKYADAYDDYLEALKTYKDSTQLFARMGITAFKAGEYDIASACINKIAGRDISKTLLAEVNTAVDGINKYYDDRDAKAKKKAPAEKKSVRGKKGGAK
jgi:tetratricopeptide (TPR) repeat protein